VHHGSIRMAAKALCLSEEGLRSRLLALEERLGVSLYEKERGRRLEVRLTPAGQAFLDKAVRLIQEAQELTEFFKPGQAPGNIKLLVSETLPCSLSSAVVQNFHVMFPDVMVNVRSCPEQQVIPGLRADTGSTVGICAPEKFSTDLVCQTWFAMDWRLVVPSGSPLSHRASVTLSELADTPLIAFEPDTTEQRYVLEAFQNCGVTPRIIVNVTSFQMAIRMVEAGMGATIVPVLPSGILMSDMAVDQVRIGDPIRPIENQVVIRHASQNDVAVRAFMNFVSRSRLFKRVEGEGAMSPVESDPLPGPQSPAGFRMDSS